MISLRANRVIENLVDGTSYRIDSYLASGGFGSTYKAHEVDVNGDNTGSPVCLKVTEHAGAWHGEAYFTGLLSPLSHTVKMHAAFPTAVRHRSRRRILFVIVLEFVETGTVRDACEQGRLPWPEARVAKRMRGLLKPLSALHDREISHRDITPGNVFIGNRATLKLGDFGIARTGLHKLGSRVDDHAPSDFMPRDAGVWWRPADDMYQVGLLMMTLLCGTEVGNDVKVPEVNQVTSRHGGLRDPLKSCLRVRARRVQTAGDLARALT